jgi:hypothetical protein
VLRAATGPRYGRIWDATVAATAHARSIPHTDKRVELERAAGELLKLAA